jgi:tetratricopeptide (TPR) repeat protein
MNIRRIYGASAMVFLGLGIAAGPALLRASQATDLLLNKSRSLEGRGRIDLASQALEQVLMADPNNTEALAGLARYAKRTGKAKEAQEYLDRLRRLDPGNAAITQVSEMSSLAQMRPRLEEAQRLVGKQDFAGAMRIYRQVFGTHPPAGGWALAYYETLAATPGGWQDGVAGLDALVAKYPESQDYRVALGRLWTYRPSTRAKGLEMLAGIKGDPDLVGKARAAWRQALIWDAGAAESIPFLREYLVRYPDSELERTLAKAEKPSEQPAEHPRVPAGSVEEGTGYRALKAGRLDQAGQAFSAALKLSPKNSKALSGLGFVRMKQQDFAAAVPLFEQALAADNKNKSISEALQTARFWKQMKDGTTALESNQLDNAVASFKAALTLRSGSLDALRALAGAYMKHNEPALAASEYDRLVRSEPANSDNWSGLLNAKYNSGHAAEAVRQFQEAPKQVVEKLSQDPEFLAQLSFAYADAGNSSEARRLFQKAQQTAGGAAQMSVGTQLQFAGLFLRNGRALQAADAFERVANAHPTNIDGWTGLISALAQVPDSMRAFTALQRMPKDTYNAALSDSNFLRAVASMHILMKRYDLAESFLEKAISIDNAAGAATTVTTELQLADVLTRNSKNSEAEKLLRQIIDEHSDAADAWLALISLLHAAKRDNAAIAEIQRMPPEVASSLQAKAGFIAVESGIYSGLGRYSQALSLIRESMRRLETERQPIPVDLQVQLAWLLLNGNGNPRELYSVLLRESTRTDLTASQREEFNRIWSIWCQRRAQAAIQAGDLPRAIGILQAALRLLPGDAKMEATLAGAYLRGGQFRQAYDIYRSWDLRGASEDDYSGAIGTAMSLHEEESATRWMQRALQKYPRNSKLLKLAGKLCIQRADYKRADAYFKAAKRNLPVEQLSKVPFEMSGDQTDTAVRNPTRVNEQRALGALLLDGAASGEAPVQPMSFHSDGPIDGGGGSVIERDGAPAIRALDPETSEPSLRQVSDDRFLPPAPSGSSGSRTAQNDAFGSPAPQSRKSLSRTVDPFDPPDEADLPAVPDSSAGQYGPSPAAQNFVSGIGLPGLPDAGSKAAPAQLSLHEEIEKDLQAVEARNTPFFDNGASVQGRTGQAGYDKLMIEQANLEASTTLGNAVRVSLMVHPTYLDAGAADGTSTLNFGSQKGGPSGVQTASGVAAEGQLATQTFGLRVGTSPDGFLVRNWVGGVRLNPAGGPITLMFNRDNVRDTMLSFAGQRDPVSNRVWGGVVSNAFSVLGNWGDENSGIYANFDYQLIRGQDVANNTRFDGSVGNYFRVYTRKDGSLTIGMNLTGMHYDKNLRYFTFGQGGYFSPQQYFLFNAPVRWTGWWRQKLQYSVSGSLGAQHFTEDSSPYYPIQPPGQPAGPGATTPPSTPGPGRRPAIAGTETAYPAFANTGANYSLDVRIGYQLTPHWLGEAFASVNNARDYTATSAGLGIKYLFDARPLSPDLNIIAVPDWKGHQPFALMPPN